MLFLRCAVIQWSEQTFAHFLSFVPFLDSKEISPTPPPIPYSNPHRYFPLLPCLFSFLSHTHIISVLPPPPTSSTPTPISWLPCAFLRAPLYCCPPLRDLHPHPCPCLQKALCKSCNCTANPTVIYFRRLLTAYKSLPSAWILSVATSW